MAQQLLQLPKVENKHWLYPFREYITGISFSGEDVVVDMHMYTDELNLSADKDELKALGIKQVLVDTPVVREYEGYIISITIDISKNNPFYLD